MSDQVQNDSSPATHQVFVTVGSRDIQLSQAALELTMDSTKAEILAKVQAVIAENLTDDDGQFSFDVRRGLTNNNLYVYPKTPAGK